MKKCDLTREELICEVKEKINEEFYLFKKSLLEQSFNSLFNNAGVIYEYTILHHYIIAMIQSFSTKQLKTLNDVETLESLVDLSMNYLPEKNAQSCKSVLNKYFDCMSDEQDGEME